jgi:hypothetical protein
MKWKTKIWINDSWIIGRWLGIAKGNPNTDMWYLTRFKRKRDQNRTNLRGVNKSFGTESIWDWLYDDHVMNLDPSWDPCVLHLRRWRRDGIYARRPSCSFAFTRLSISVHYNCAAFAVLWINRWATELLILLVQKATRGQLSRCSLVSGLWMDSGHFEPTKM